MTDDLTWNDMEYNNLKQTGIQKIIDILDTRGQGGFRKQI